MSTICLYPQSAFTHNSGTTDKWNLIKVSGEDFSQKVENQK